MATLALGAFVTSVNTTVLSPLLKPIAAQFHVSDAATGQLATVTAAAAAATALVTAPWMDRYSRRVWLCGECALLGLGTLLSALAPGFAWLFAGRALAGLGGATIFATCQAGVSDLFSDPNERNRAIGLIGTGATLGAVAGLPLVTQIAALAGWRWALAALLPLIAVVVWAASQLPGTAPAPEGSLWRGWMTGYRTVLRQRETVWLLAVMVVLCLVWFGWLIYFGTFATTAFNVGASKLTLLFLVSGAAEIVGANVTPVLLQRLRPRTVVGLAAIVLSLDLAAVGVVYTREWELFPFVAGASLASVTAFTATSILLLDSLPAARGAVVALQSAGFELGGALGAAGTGVGLAVLHDFAAVYRLLGLVLLLTLVLLYLSGREAQASAQPG